MVNKEPVDNREQLQEAPDNQEVVAGEEQPIATEEFTPDPEQLDTHQHTLEHIHAELQTIQKDYEDLKDKHIRLLAEFENHKRRTVREKLDMMKTASQDILTALLPVLDDFDRAAHNDQLSEGVQLVYQKLYNTLKNKGLDAMQSTGEPFNPELHAAITEIPAPSEDLKGKVVDTVEKGYMLGDKIIRHAKVVVGK